MSDYSARITLNAYRMVGKVIYPFMGPFPQDYVRRRGKEDVSRRYERYGYPSAERPDGPLIWFHAASVGETMADNAAD